LAVEAVVLVVLVLVVAEMMAVSGCEYQTILLLYQ
jgi:hypothetical protein